MIWSGPTHRIREAKAQETGSIRPGFEVDVSGRIQQSMQPACSAKGKRLFRFLRKYSHFEHQARQKDTFRRSSYSRDGYLERSLCLCVLYRVYPIEIYRHGGEDIHRVVRQLHLGAHYACLMRHVTKLAKKQSLT